MSKAKAKTKPVPSPATTPSSTALPLPYTVAFWGLMAILFFSPYFRGLFFAREQYWALALAAVSFFGVWWGKVTTNDNRMFDHPLDYLMLALPAVYLFSFFFAVNSGLAADEILRAVLYFLAFWIAVRVIVSTDDLHRAFHVIYLSAAGVALAGLATATGIIEIRDGFLNGRIYSSFQYPNALANYLMAVLFLGFYLWQRRVLEPRQKHGDPLGGVDLPQWLRKIDFYPFYPYFYALGNFLLLAVFFGTKSQGGSIVFGLLLPLFLLGLPSARRFPVAAHLVLAAVPAFLASNRFLGAVAAERFTEAWLWILAGFILVAIEQLVFELLYRSSLKERIEAYGSRLVLAGLGVGLLGMILFILTNWEMIQEALKWHNLEHRFNYIFTAWRMVLERPLTGWGGGGWADAYQGFLPYHYITSQVHGHYLQVGVETGIGGMLLFVAIWGVFLWTAIRLYRGAADDPGRRTLVLAVALASGAVGVHSALDFNFSLGALALVVWVLFGGLVGLARGAKVVAAAEAVPERRRRRQSAYVPRNYTRLAVVGVCAVLILSVPLVFSSASARATQGLKLLQQGQVDEGLASLRLAATYNPFSGEYNYLLAQIHQAMGDQNTALAEIERALDKNQYNPVYYETRALILQARGDYAGAVESAETAVAKAPMAVERYANLAHVYSIAGYGELQGGNPEAAEEYFEDTLQVPERMRAIMDGLDENQQRWWKGPRLTVTPELQFPLGVSKYFLGDFEGAEAALAETTGADDAAQGEFLVWRALVAEAQGKTESSAKLLAEAKALNPEVGQLYAEVGELPTLNVK